MFFPGGNRYIIQIKKRQKDIIQKTNMSIRKERKTFPARYQRQFYREGIFQFISVEKRRTSGTRCARRKGSLTLEMAMVLPLFLFAMLAMLQFATVESASSALLAGAQDTAKEMAAYACIQNMGITEKEGVPAELLKGGLSAGYARGQIQKKSGVKKETGSFSLVQSAFTDSEILDLVGNFQPAHTWSVLPVKKVKSIFRARVRAWTGRTGNSSGNSEEAEEKQQDEEQVYVTETGNVYHMDPECTHIRLSIKNVSKNQLKGLRNVNGGKYHACEKCKGGNGSQVYISPYGDKYHSSLNCSGLKRTVNTVPLSEVKNWKPCSKCGKKQH